MAYCDRLINYFSGCKTSGFNFLLNTIIENKHTDCPDFVYPYYLNIILTKKCNTKCLFCSADSIKGGEKQYFADDDVLEAISKLIQDTPPLILALCGGEPMLYPSECIKYMNLCDENMAIYLLTNLNYRLTDLHIAVFQKMEKHKYSLIQTSIDTLDSSLLDFLRSGSNLHLIVKNIKTIKEKFGKIKLKVNITISDYNFKEINKILQFCADENVDLVHCNFVIPIGRANRNVSLSSFFKVIRGLSRVEEFSLSQKCFYELTISIPVEVAIIRNMFSYNFDTEINLDELENNISSRQYVCNVNPQEKTCYAGWEGSKQNNINKVNLTNSYIDAAKDKDLFRFRNCIKCKFRNICNENTAYFPYCFLSEFKKKIDTIARNGNRYAAKELARNRVHDMFQSSKEYFCIDLIVTNVCNGNCFFCQANGSRNDEGLHFSISDFEQFIGNTSVHISITGGEPLLKSDYVESIIKIVKKTPGSTICLLTNLSTLHDEQIAVFKDNFGYFDVIQVSIYSHDPVMHKKICGRNDWDRVNENIRKLVAANISVRANLTLNKYNIFDIEDIYNFYMKLGVEHICISCLLDKGLAEGMVDEEYILTYVFEAAKFAELGYYNYNIVIPIDALRCYNNCINFMGDGAQENIKNHEVQENSKLYISHNGDLFYLESMEEIRNVSSTLLAKVSKKKFHLEKSACTKCNSFSICGGKIMFTNGLPNSCCVSNM